MKLETIIAKSRRFVQPYRVTSGKQFSLRHFDPDDIGSFKKHGKANAEKILAEGVEALSALQERLYASNTWSVLLVFQAMDAAGKDSAIKHVMSGINPQGCQVFSFKAPTSEELDHDFLWRCTKCLPERGRIGIFNRSYYEETLIVRVHPEFLQSQKLPPKLITKNIWNDRFADIRNFERYLTGNGFLIRKFFLHVSKGEQERRFLARLDDPHKNWKFSVADVKEREHWDDYMKAYEETIRNTATEYAPWHVVPADNKWFTRLVVASTIVEALASLKLEYPKIGAAKKKELDAARLALADKT